MTPATPPDKEASRGVAFGLCAYLMWGCFPLFFALFESTPAWEVLIHRVLWSCVFLAGLVTLLKRWGPVRGALARPRRLGRVLACAVLIGANWGIYIYAVESRHVFQASLGYFLTPLVNVALGMLILKERMSRLQGVAVLLAAAAILGQLVMLGELPWITLTLAISFGTYGLLRKQVPLDGLSGLFVETLLLFPLAVLALAGLSVADQSHFLQGDTRATNLLIASGVITALPLMAFAGAARRLRLATIGFLMYLNPTLQFFIALLVFHEPLDPVQLATFVLIWIGLALYSYSAWQGRSRARAA
ncbi:MULTISPECIES: EamA family transporter RarD [unclassified Modicisalibacter]|uniref:EamA family transporter RarD n=1 Tax=unclassified Modicisalibacter TaxID=2679913 RepID=UPI001CCE4D06|nr:MULTISPECIES: EamA family transporter RarD [unclassified Modicisalibacter]MBZ9556722.1 EamA family transporter RarD [Modicisalibacter sp. R2A 31.J]MBZ9574809.1 EamA family transporter RarD [Modicisalibacter sp. MOD 31.J]